MQSAFISSVMIGAASSRGSLRLAIRSASRVLPCCRARIQPHSRAPWQRIRNKRNRSRHHKGFREPDAIARLRQDNFKSLRKGLEREGIAAADVDVHLQTLAEDGALESAINWYRANTIASAIAPVSMPTLYIWGTADASVGRRAAELTAQFVRVPTSLSRSMAAATLLSINFPIASRSF